MATFSPSFRAKFMSFGTAFAELVSPDISVALIKMDCSSSLSLRFCLAYLLRNSGASSYIKTSRKPVQCTENNWKWDLKKYWITFIFLNTFFFFFFNLGDCFKHIIFLINLLPIKNNISLIDKINTYNLANGP